MKIEIATTKDLNILHKLIQKQFLEHEIDYEDDQLKSAIDQMLTNDSLGFFLIAKEKNQSLGFAVISFAWTLEHGGKSAWLDELYVLPEHRNAGIGSAIVDRLFIEAKEKGCLAVDLEVESDHRRAENLYVRKGFQKLDRSRWAQRI
jgi:ribosomal protein S18 acetylase RimI-like enzyme